MPVFAAVLSSLLPLPARFEAAAAQTPPVPGENLTIHVLTIGPGDRVEELFGHNAVLVRDTVSGFEAAYNFGLFDLGAEGFLFNFLRGRMMYRVAPLPLDGMLAAYRAAGRTVWAQELDLEPARRAHLFELLLTAVQPENHSYRYEYFLNNCSTRIRDLLDLVLGGQLRAATDSLATAGVTWRYHTRRLTARSPHFFAGIDLLLGPRGDEPTNRWLEMWVPMKLRDAVGALTIERSDGSRARLVRSEAVWVEATRDAEGTTTPSRELLLLIGGIVLGALLVGLDELSRRSVPGCRAGMRILGGLWGTFCFVAGTLLLLMHLTDHEFMYWNRNALVFSPLGIGILVALVRGNWGWVAPRVALGSVGLALLALALYLIPWTRQENLMMIAFALPVHLAVLRVVANPALASPEPEG